MTSLVPRRNLSTRRRLELEYFVDKTYRNDVSLFPKSTNDVITRESDSDSVTKFDLNNDIAMVNVVWTGSFPTGFGRGFGPKSSLPQRLLTGDFGTMLFEDLPCFQ